MISMEKAQASMEYLLLLAAMLFFFSLLLPLLQKSYALTFFAVDVGNAKNFARELQTKANELSFLSDGSAIALKAKPIESWLIKAEGSELLITVKSSSLQREKVFTAELPNAVFFPETAIEGETVFFLKKEGNTVLLEN